MLGQPFTIAFKQSFTSGETGPILFPRMLPLQRFHATYFSLANSAASNPTAQPVIDRMGIQYVIGANITVTNNAANATLADFWLMEGDAFGFLFGGAAQTGTYTLVLSGTLYNLAPGEPSAAQA